MKRDIRLFLDDILKSILLIEKYSQGVTKEQFHTSEEKQDGITRRLEIIGEATRNIPEDVREKYPNIPWSKMAGIRNIIAHEYFGVNFNTIWETATEFIPPLKKHIEELLEQLDKTQ